MSCSRHTALLMLLATVALAGLIRIPDFGGLNTNSSFNRIQPNQCSRSMNWVLDDPIGALSLRDGYSQASTTGTNLLWPLSLHSHRYQTGEGILFQTWETDGDSGVAALMSSAPFGVAPINTLVYPLYPKRGHWVTWRGKDYFFNGRNVPWVTHGGPDKIEADELIRAGFGQPELWPTADTVASGGPDGEYIYAFLTTIPCSLAVLSSRCGTFSLPVVTHGEAVYVTNIPNMPIADTGCTSYSYEVLVLRSRANRTDVDDSLFILDTLGPYAPITNNTGNIYKDVLPDDSIGIAAHPFWKTIGAAHDSVALLTRGGVGNHAYAAGSPTFLGRFASDNVVLDTTTDSAVCYVIAEYDTLLNIVTDTSCQIRIPAGNKSDSGLRIALPKPQWPGFFPHRYRYYVLRAKALKDSSGARIWYHIASPSFHMFPDTTIYSDSLSQADAVLTKDIMSLTHLNSIPLGAVVHEERMYTYDRERVYISKTDTAAQFDYFDEIEIGVDDGDRITGIASLEGYVVIYKTNSVWILYTQDGQIVDRSKRSVGYGLVAPHSLADYNGANVYLGKGGVTIETDSRYRTEKLNRRYESDPIKNILVRDIDDMREAVAVVFEDRYLLSYPGTDSTFVYYFKVQEWNTWSFDFLDACLYDTVQRSEFVPFADLYFIQDNRGKNIFVGNDAIKTDVGVPTWFAVWEKKYLGYDLMGHVADVVHLAKEMDGCAPNYQMGVVIEDEEGNQIDSIRFDSLAYFADYAFVAPTSNMIASWFTVRVTMQNYNCSPTLNGLHLEEHSVGRPPRR